MSAAGRWPPLAPATPQTQAAAATRQPPSRQATPANPEALTPWGIAVDQTTDTIYVTLEAQGDYAGSVAVIDGATCNGSDTTGCGQTPPAVAAGFGVDEMAIDPAIHEIYTTNTEDASLSVIDGATCNRFATSGCGLVPPTVPAGSYPGFSPGTITIDSAAGTAFVTGQSGVSVIPLSLADREPAFSGGMERGQSVTTNGAAADLHMGRPDHAGPNGDPTANAARARIERTCEPGDRQPQGSSRGTGTETNADARRPPPAPLSLPRQRSARNAAIAAVSSGAAKALP